MIKKVTIKISGKNIYSFLKRIYKNDIEIYNTKYIDIHNIYLTVSEKDYYKILKITKTYKIKLIKLHGINYIKYKIIEKKIFLISFLLSFIFLIYISTFITDVEVIHSDTNIRNFVFEILDYYDIEKYMKIKSYKKIDQIKKEILEKYKDKIEWIEIERIGTKYIVKLEERKIFKKNNDNNPCDIVSNSYAIIKSIKSEHGEIIKNINDYVKKGDTVISGSIKLNDIEKAKIKATGTVYGEVWYKVTVEYPLNYIEEKVTKEKKKIYTISFLSKKIELTFKKNKYKIVNKKEILKHNILPISINKEIQAKKEVINQKLTKEEAILKAIDKVEEKVKKSLNEDEYIISIKKLKVEENNSKIILETFVTVMKNITKVKLLE